MESLDKKIKGFLVLAGQRASKMRYKESWVSLVGRETLRFDYMAKPDKVLYTLKWETDRIVIYDKAGKKHNEVKSAQKLSDSTTKKSGKSDKQQD